MRIDFSLGVVLLLVCLAQGLTTAAWLLLARPRRPGQAWLGLLVGALTLQVLDYFLSWSGIYAQHKALYFSPLFYSLSFGPLLLNYLRARYAAGPPLPGRHWLPVAGQALFFGVLCLQSFDTKTWFWLHVHKPVTRYVEYYAALTSALLYLSWARRLARPAAERASVSAVASAIGPATNPARNPARNLPTHLARPLRLLQGFCLVAALDPLVNYLYLPAGAPRFYLLSLGLPALAYAVALGSWLKSRAPAVVAKVAEVASAVGPAAPKVAPPPDLAQLARLVEALEAGHLYRDPDLTLAALGQRLGLTPNAVSALINAGLGLSFTEWVNGYRLAEVERRLRSADAQRFTLLALAFDAGFNSKTTFNRVFKDKHGVAPSAWAKTAAAPPDSAENASQRAFRDDAGGATG